MKKSNWKQTTLKEIVNVRKDLYSKSDGWDFVNYLDTGSITQNVISQIQKLDVDTDEIPSRAKRKVFKDDIVYSTVRPNQRHFGILRDVSENMLVSTGFTVINAKENIADNGFIFRFLSQDKITDLLQAIAEHSTSTYPAIRDEDILKLEIELPPLQTQQKIADTLGSLDDKIELNNEMNKTLEEMAKAIFKSWFVDFDIVKAKQDKKSKQQIMKDFNISEEVYEFFPSSFEGGVPKGWKTTKLIEEFDLLMGQSPKGDTYNNNGIGIAFFQGCTDFGFRFPADRVFCSQPLRMGKKGNTILSVRAPVGEINMLLEDACIGRGCCVLIHKTKASSYTYYSMNSIKGLLNNFNASGTVFGSVTKTDLENIDILAPSKEIVAEFERIASNIDDKIINNEKENQKLSEIRDYLLPRLISGKVGVN